MTNQEGKEIDKSYIQHAEYICKEQKKQKRGGTEEAGGEKNHGSHEKDSQAKMMTNSHPDSNMI